MFNVINLNLYHYAGNNPIKYTDPDGKIAGVDDLAVGLFILGSAAVVAYSSTDNFQEGTAALADVIVDGANNLKEKINDAAGKIQDKLQSNADSLSSDSFPEEDKDAIAQHAHDGGHGQEVNIDDPSESGIKQKIDDILNDPDTKVGTRSDGATGYLSPDGTLLIHNPKAEDKGTIFYPDNPDKYFNNDFNAKE